MARSIPQKISFAALRVESLPRSQVFLNDNEVGKTPFEDEKLTPGEYSLRLLPETSATFSSWERKIKLNPGLLTYVNYIFGSTESQSAGEVLTLEKSSQENGEMVVLSDPEGANFSLDGQLQGATPKALSGFGNEEHEISFSLAGHHGRSLKIRTLKGYKLLASVKLAKIIEEEVAIPSVDDKERVRILETPTGWLRVRAEPTINAIETAKVKPGEEYTLIEEVKDWLKIEHQEGKEGWISSQYAQKVE